MLTLEVALSTVEWESDSDAIETFGLGPWKHFVPLTCAGHVVPTVALELRLATEVARGRADRNEPLLDHLTTNGCDLDLVRRGLIAREVPEALQSQVLARLGTA